VNATRIAPTLEARLSRDLDKWTRHVVQRTFDPVTGSPYWLRRAPMLPFDPRDITRYDELPAFGPFPLDGLRALDPTALVPLAVPRPLAGMVWESGGSTGTPCRVFYTEPMLTHRADWRRLLIERAGFERARSWLQVTPTGPHLLGHTSAMLTDDYDGLVYRVDFDPRWVKRLVRKGQMTAAAEYTDHVIDQTLDIMRTQPVDYLITTPAVLQALIRTEPEMVARMGGAWMSGTHATRTMWRSFHRLFAGKPLFVMYGNTFGNTFALPVQQDGELMPHVPAYPEVTMSVVSQNDWTQPVDYGSYGRVRLTVMHEDLFLPNILERDLAMRFDTGSEWPCDGVANVRPYQEESPAVEGIY
jgi:hypothetical protein